MTIGLNFHSINIPIHKKDTVESSGLVINSIFDFGGQDRFKPLIPKFLGGANGALLIFDLTNPISFEQLKFWHDQLLEHAEGSKIPKILVGSKSDLLDSSPRDKIIQEEVIKDFVKEKELDGFFKTSALKNHNVLEVFKELNNMILRYNNTSYIVS
jgi:small GTP-binding protein